MIQMFSGFTKKNVRHAEAGTTQVTGKKIRGINLRSYGNLGISRRKWCSHPELSECLKSSNSTVSTKRRIITRNGSSGLDIQELQCMNGNSLNKTKASEDSSWDNFSNFADTMNGSNQRKAVVDGSWKVYPLFRKTWL